jgi:hypothetical protein
MDKLEQLMGLPYTDSSLDPTGNTHQDPQNADGFTVSWDITNNSPTQNTKLIEITVAGKGKRLLLTSVRSQSL